MPLAAPYHRSRSLALHRAINACHAHPDGKGDAETLTPFGLEKIDGCLGGGIQTHGLHEVRCAESRSIASAAAFALGLTAQLHASGRKKLFWVLDPVVALDSGIPFPDGLSQFGIDPLAITFVRPITLHDALWAADQAANCADLSAVILQVKGNPKRFDMTATRRLMLRARQSRVTVCILRQSGNEEATAVATRWRAEVLPSVPEQGFETGLGQPRHHLTLERNRLGATGNWPLIWNPETGKFEDGTVKPPAAYPVRRVRPLAHGPDRPAEMGQVMDLERAS